MNIIGIVWYLGSICDITPGGIGKLRAMGKRWILNFGVWGLFPAGRKLRRPRRKIEPWSPPQWFSAVPGMQGIFAHMPTEDNKSSSGSSIFLHSRVRCCTVARPLKTIVKVMEVSLFDSTGYTQYEFVMRLLFLNSSSSSSSSTSSFICIRHTTHS